MKTFKVLITKQELWDIGFEKVVIDGVEYVDKAPLLMDSTCPLSRAYYDLLERKRKEHIKNQRKIRNLESRNRKGEVHE